MRKIYVEIKIEAEITAEEGVGMDDIMEEMCLYCAHEDAEIQDWSINDYNITDSK